MESIDAQEVQLHGKPRLALAVLTSPSAAFEEIVQRRLLGTAIGIVAVTGVLAAVAALVRGASLGPVQFFTLGKENPLCWLGVCMLYALVLQGLLKWLGGSEIEYEKVLCVLGWSHMPLLALQIVTLVGSALAAGNHLSQEALQLIDTARAGLQIWYVAVVALGIHVTSRIPVARAAMSYLAVALAGMMALGLTYSNSRLAPFRDALPGVANTASIVVGSDTTPWLAAAVVGLCVGLWWLAKSRGWDDRARNRLVVSAAFIGLAGLALYIGIIYKTDYYGKLIAAQSLYNRDHFAEAGERLERLLPIARNNAALMLDIADIYLQAGYGEKSEHHYREFLRGAAEAGLAKNDGLVRARAYSGIGSVYDAQGKYAAAIEQFKKASKAWPEFRDPWVRMAVTYDQIGDYKNAIESANHAVKKLDSEATVAWVALAQAFVNTGDAKQAKAAIAMVAGRDADLAKRIESKPDDWKDAVSKLTAKDLKYPLEKEPFPRPKKPEPVGKPK